MLQSETPVKVWDAPVRLFHWLLVLLIAFQYLSARMKGDWLTWHMYSGYTILALVLFRILWGFAGSSTARFSTFIAGPSATLQFAKKILARAPAPHASHNPLGGWMVVVLLLSLLAQAGTGLFANDDVATEGPLANMVSKEMSDRLSSIHYWNFNLLLVLGGLHVAAVLYHWGVMKENLIGAMFTGVKRLPAEAAAGGAVGVGTRFASPWRALVLLAVAALAVYLIVRRPF
jgi:cytochrome b